MKREIPDWVLEVVHWTQNDFLASIFEKAGKNSKKALELLKAEHGKKAQEILENIDKKPEIKNHE